MSAHIALFKQCCFQAGEKCKVGNGLILRRYGLLDFCENVLADDDDHATVAVKALQFFCEGKDPREDQFMIGALATTLFLDSQRSSRSKSAPIQELKDLVACLADGFDEVKVRRWILSNF